MKRVIRGMDGRAALELMLSCVPLIVMRNPTQSDPIKSTKTQQLSLSRVSPRSRIANIYIETSFGAAGAARCPGGMPAGRGRRPRAPDISRPISMYPSEESQRR